MVVKLSNLTKSEFTEAVYKSNIVTTWEAVDDDDRYLSNGVFINTLTTKHFTITQNIKYILKDSFEIVLEENDKPAKTNLRFTPTDFTIDDLQELLDAYTDFSYFDTDTLDIIKYLNPDKFIQKIIVHFDSLSADKKAKMRHYAEVDAHYFMIENYSISEIHSSLNDLLLLTTEMVMKCYHLLDDDSSARKSIATTAGQVKEITKNSLNNLWIASMHDESYHDRVIQLLKRLKNNRYTAKIYNFAELMFNICIAQARLVNPKDKANSYQFKFFTEFYPSREKFLADT